METKLEQIAAKAVKQRPKSVVREIRTPRSVGTGGGRPPPVTRWAPSNGCPYRNREKARYPIGAQLILKAYTARSFRTSTAAYAKRFADNDPVVRQQVTLPNVIAIPGGLPIKVGDDVIGGAAVSGSPGVDEPCVQAGLDKIADQLK
jgi:Haem-degrading